jgi:hypothetical protein
MKEVLHYQGRIFFLAIHRIVHAPHIIGSDASAELL